MNVDKKVINKKITLHLPVIPDEFKKRSKDAAQGLAKTMALFEAAGRGKKRLDIVAWGENRHYFLRTLFYLYLFKKYKNSCITTVQPSCTLLSDICQKYGDIIFALYTFNISDKKKKKDYLQYQKNFSSDIVRCLKTRKMVVVPLRLYFNKGSSDSASGGSHANLLIFRRGPDGGTVETFEPHGQYYGGGDVSGTVVEGKYRDFVLKAFNPVAKRNKLGSFVYMSSYAVCPVDIKHGMQSLEGYSSITKYMKEGGGYCSIWSMFMTELILKNPEYTTREILERFHSMLGSDETYSNRVKMGNYLHNMIRGYATFITKKVQKYNKLIFGEAAMKSIQLGKGNFTYEGYNTFRIYFQMYLDIQSYLILNKIKAVDLQDELSSKRAHPLKKIYYRGIKKTVFDDFLEAIARQERNVKYSSVMERHEPEEFVTEYTYAPCPPGKVINPKTGRCNKIKKPKVKKPKKTKAKTPKQTKPKPKQTPVVKVKKTQPVKKKIVIVRGAKPTTKCGVNPKTGRCKIGFENVDGRCQLKHAADGVRKNCTKKKVVKPKTVKKRRSRCPNGTRRDTKTGKCVKRT